MARKYSHVMVCHISDCVVLVDQARDESCCYDCASWTLIFLPSISPSLLPYHCTTNTPPSLLVIALSWTYSPIPRLGQGALRTVRFLPYLWHALPSLLLQYLHTHQCLLVTISPFLLLTVWYMTHTRLSDCWCAPFVSLLCPSLLIAALCIIAPFVHATGPP